MPLQALAELFATDSRECRKELLDDRGERVEAPGDPLALLAHLRGVLLAEHTWRVRHRLTPDRVL